MSVSVQQKIAPPTPQNAQDFSAAKGYEEEEAIDSIKQDKTSFKDLILNSMEDIKKEREAEKNGDLSTAKTDAEFLERISDSSKPKQAPKNALDKDDFLKLFVTQLQNQDPLNPDNGAEMATKLAQFNGVEQMINVNSSLKKLLEAQTSTKSMAMLQYMGKEASIDGGRVAIKGGNVDDVNYNSLQDSPKSSIQIFDKQGNIVAEQNVGFIKKGLHQFKWDGKNKVGEPLNDGNYSFKLISNEQVNAPSPIDIKTRALITGLDMQNQENALLSTVGELGWSEIKAINSIIGTKPKDQTIVEFKPPETNAGQPKEANRITETGSQPNSMAPISQANPPTTTLDQKTTS